MTMLKEEDTTYKDTNNSEDINKVIDELEDFPYIPKNLLDKLKDVFDIRKMIWYETSRDTLMGIQQVIHYLEERYEHQNNKNL